LPSDHGTFHTFTLAENEAVIQSFLASAFSPLIHSLTLRTWPHLTQTDGFTVFRLRKNEK